MRTVVLRAVLVVVLTVLSTAGSAAQSLTSMRGLGYPIIATDARSEALGGLGIGLVGLAVPFTNPASPADVATRGVVASAAVTERTTAVGDVSARTGATRFPLMRIVFPVRSVVLTGGYGSFLDQSWAVVREGSQPLGSGAVDYRDVLESVGGVGRVQVGAAVPLGERLAVGVTIGSYTGSQRLSVRRFFDSTSIGNLESYAETKSVQYSGPMASAGFRWDLDGVARVAGSVTWSGRLTADSTDGVVATRGYDMPLQVAGGASAYLAPGLLAAVSGRWSGWSATDASGGLLDPVATTTSHDTWELGAGLELDDPERRAGRSFPVRLGFQYRQLPFTFVADQPVEWLATAGVGMRLGSDFETPLARLDLTVQRGARTAAGNATIPDLEETIWRVVLGVSIFGT